MIKDLSRYIILIILILNRLSTASGQPVTVSATLDSTQILLGDQVHLKLELLKPSGAEVDWVTVPDTLAGKIEVLQRSQVDTFRMEDERLKLVQDFLVTCFDSGYYVLEPFKFTFRRDGITDSAFTNELYMKVLTLEIDTTRGPADIKMPYDAPVTLKEVTPYLLGAILAGALLFLAFYSIRRKQKNLPLFTRPARPREPAHITALRELDRIREEKLWQKGKIKEFYSDVTGVLRTYMEERFGIPALERTTVEIITTFLANRSLIGEKSLNHLNQMLPLADLVKFAKYQPLPDDHHMVLANAYFFVNETRAAEPETPGNQPDDEEPGEEVTLK